MNPNSAELSTAEQVLRDAALAHHCSPSRGKIALMSTKPLRSQHDLLLAYSPGTPDACLAIEADPSLGFA